MQNVRKWPGEIIVNNQPTPHARCTRKALNENPTRQFRTALVHIGFGSLTTARIGMFIQSQLSRYLYLMTWIQAHLPDRFVKTALSFRKIGSINMQYIHILSISLGNPTMPFNNQT